ncbi:hypothetical protein GN956_G18689 [Arapaima gigas]
MIFTRQLLLSSLKGDKWCSFDQLIPFMATSEGGELLGSRLSEDLNPLTNQWLAGGAPPVTGETFFGHLVPAVRGYRIRSFEDRAPNAQRHSYQSGFCQTNQATR